MKTLNEHIELINEESKYSFVAANGGLKNNKFESLLMKAVSNVVKKNGLKLSIKSDDWEFARRIGFKGMILPIKIWNQDRSESIEGDARIDDKGKVVVNLKEGIRSSFYSSIAVGRSPSMNKGIEGAENIVSQIDAVINKVTKSYPKIFGDIEKYYDEHGESESNDILLKKMKIK